MAKIISLRSAQYPLVAHQVLNFSDWCVDAVTSVKKTFGSTVAASSAPSEPSLTNGKNTVVAIPLFNMPRGAIIIGGSVVTETAWVGPTNAMDIGLLAGGVVGTELISNFNCAATTVAEFAVSTSVRLTSATGLNLYANMDLSNADATAGKVHVFVNYFIEGKANEVLPN